MTRIPDPHAGKQPHEIEGPDLVDGLRDQIAHLSRTLRTIANDPKCPPHIAVLARTGASPHQG